MYMYASLNEYMFMHTGGFEWEISSSQCGLKVDVQSRMYMYM